MKRYSFVLSLCFIFISCNQNPSQAEKDYIKNLEEKNKILEKELQEEKNKPNQIDNTQTSKQKIKSSLGYFTIGSTEAEVIEIMGNPTSYYDMGYGGKRFQYGLSSIYFEKGKVKSYNNLDDNLKVNVKE